jgi:hypothetical protein
MAKSAWEPVILFSPEQRLLTSLTFRLSTALKQTGYGTETQMLK